MTHKGADFAFRPPASLAVDFAGAMKGLGYSFVVRYISHDSSKNLTAYEIAAYRGAGLQIVTVFEDAAERALAGGAAGVMDAKFAQNYLRGLRAPGGHAGAPVYFAVDFDASASQAKGAIRNYVRGAAQVLGRASTGIYSGDAVVAACKDITGYQWQTVAWSGGRWVAGIELEQFADGGTTLGVQWDLDDALAADFGAWKFPGAVIPAPPPPFGSGGGGGGKVPVPAVPLGIVTANQGEDMQIPAGQHEITPVSIPVGTKNLHLVCGPQGASLEIQFHDGKPAVPVEVTWAHGSSWVAVPAKVGAAYITRTDAGFQSVDLKFEV